MEDWNNTSGVIYEIGKYRDDDYVYGQSCWATPILDVDGEEIECWTEEHVEYNLQSNGMPKWWCTEEIKEIKESKDV